jgi:hypothetical protein
MRSDHDGAAEDRGHHHAVERHAPERDLLDKGLAKGKVGTFSGAVLGISSVAPATRSRRASG